jgi:adenosyl cobinamide kinase/adenosyl cobinamide phosphate guanylyltransferase
MTMVCLERGQINKFLIPYSHYADQVMETLLVKMLPVMAKETGLDLVPTYSYARIYKKVIY